MSSSPPQPASSQVSTARNLPLCPPLHSASLQPGEHSKEPASASFSPPQPASSQVSTARNLPLCPPLHSARLQPGDDGYTDRPLSPHLQLRQLGLPPSLLYHRIRKFLKGPCHEIFDTGFFMIIFPQAPEKNVRDISV